MSIKIEINTQVYLIGRVGEVVHKKVRRNNLTEKRAADDLDSGGFLKSLNTQFS